LAAFWRLFFFLRINLVSMNYSIRRNKVLQSLLLAVMTGGPSLASAFTYSDSDVLLVFRKDGFNDVEFNLGSVSNFLGRADGTRVPVNNWDLNVVNTTFNNNLNGVKFVLCAATEATNALRRVWATSASLYPSTPVTDLAGSKWGQLRAKISTVGTEATNITAGSAGLTYIAPFNDATSYTVIVTEGIGLDPATMGGTASFPVEGDIPGTLLFYQLKVSNLNPKPAALLVGSFCLDAGGALSFTAGPLLPLPRPTINISRAGTVNTITFLTTNCGNYRLRYASDLAGPWTIATTVVTGNGSAKTLTDTTAAAMRFYVVEVFR
jgi:hypothetical protein